MDKQVGFTVKLKYVIRHQRQGVRLVAFDGCGALTSMQILHMTCTWCQCWGVTRLSQVTLQPHRRERVCVCVCYRLSLAAVSCSRLLGPGGALLQHQHRLAVLLQPHRVGFHILNAEHRAHTSRVWRPQTAAGSVNTITGDPQIAPGRCSGDTPWGCEWSPACRRGGNGSCLLSGWWWRLGGRRSAKPAAQSLHPHARWSPAPVHTHTFTSD